MLEKYQKAAVMHQLWSKISAAFYFQ